MTDAVAPGQGTTLVPRAGDRARLSAMLKLTYGTGQGIDAVVNGIVNTFLLFYLTAVCGMAPSIAGSVFLVSLAVDAVLDPFIGRLSDKTRTRWGRRLPFMGMALPPMALALWLMFSIPAGLTGGALFGYALALNIVVRVSLSVFNLPHSALTAELSDDYNERSSISTFRALFVVLGTAAAILPAFSLIFAQPNALQSREAYPALGLLAACLVIGFGLTCVLGIARRVLQMPMPREDTGEASAGFFAELLQLTRNPSFVPLFIGAVVALAGQGIAAALNLHAYRFFWQLPSSLIQLPLLVLPIGMLIGTVAAALLLKRIEKRTGVIAAVLMISVYPAVAALLVAVGIVVPGSGVSIALAIFNGLLVGACGTLCFICFFSMIADAVDEHDLLFGVRREALYAAALMIGGKAAGGLGAFLGGVGLQAIGFNAPPEGGTVPAEVATSVGLLWGPGAAIVMLSSIPFLLRYKISRAHHADVVDALSVRASGVSLGDEQVSDLVHAAP